MLSDSDKTFLGKYLTQPNPFRQYAKQLIQEEMNIQISQDFSQFLHLFMKILINLDQYVHMKGEIQNIIRWFVAVYNCNPTFVEIITDIFQAPHLLFIIKNLSAKEKRII